MQGSPMNRRVLLLAGLGVALTSCLPKQQPVQAPSQIPVTFVGVMQTQQSAAVGDLPAVVQGRLVQTLSERNLAPETKPAAAWAEDFAKRRSTEPRLRWLVEQGGVSHGLILLVETEVSFYAQLQGRYRWTVDVRATIAGADDVSASTTERFSVPVFLLFDHEREEEALIEAGPDIARKVGVMLDWYVGGL